MLNSNAALDLPALFRSCVNPDAVLSVPLSKSDRLTAFCPVLRTARHHGVTWPPLSVGAPRQAHRPFNGTPSAAPHNKAHRLCKIRPKRRTTRRRTL